MTKYRERMYTIMNITIGEIANILLPFTTSLKMYIHEPFPYISASIGNGSAISKLFISVMQTQEHLYSASIGDDVYGGNRLIPTGYTEMPFIREKNFYGYSTEVPTTFNLNPSNFRLWLMKTMYLYNITRFNPNDFTLKITDMGFNSVKIKRIIDRIFKSFNRPSGTVSDLITIVNTNGKEFNLYRLEDKEIKCVYAKLKNIGLEPIIVDKRIIRIDYERRT